MPPPLSLLALLLAAAPALAAPARGAWPPLPLRASAFSNGVSWQVLSNTYLSAGSDLSNASMTVAEAEAACASDARCRGFTYDGTGLPGPAYNMLLKSAISTGSGEGWVAYLKSEPRVLTGSFANGAVIQHDAPCLSGYGSNVTGAAVTIITDADGGAPYVTTVSADNTWRLCLPAMAPGGPHTINVTVAGFGSEVLSDVLFGERVPTSVPKPGTAHYPLTLTGIRSRPARPNPYPAQIKGCGSRAARATWPSR